MTDLPPPSGSGAELDRPARPGIPRWLKVTGIVLVVVALLVIGLVLLTGDEGGTGRHGPGQHGLAGPGPAASQAYGNR